MVATSLTVTYSVTLRILLSNSCCTSSLSDCCLCRSLFSRRYFAPLPLELFPWSFSKVSRTWRCTSSSLGSARTTGVCFPFAAWLRWLVSFLSFKMRLRLRLRSAFCAADTATVSFFFFSNCERSTVAPVSFGPDSFWYCVLNWSEAGSSAFGASFTLAIASVGAASAATSTVIATSASAVSDVISGAATATSWASSVITSSTGAAAGCLGSRSILPTFFCFTILILALISSFSFFSLAWRFSSCSFSICWSSASFSLRFSSPTSWEAAFFDISVWNSSNSTWYTSPLILVVGRASISWPFSLRCSTARSREILSSRSTLFNRMVSNSDI